MEQLLALLNASVSQIAADAAVISQNFAAMNSMGEDVLAAVGDRQPLDIETLVTEGSA